MDGHYKFYVVSVLFFLSSDESTIHFTDLKNDIILNNKPKRGGLTCQQVDYVSWIVTL